MVSAHLICRGVTDPKVIEAFRKVPRERFVSPEYEDSAYDDNPLPIGRGQTISQPYMVGLMTQELGLTGGEKVLEIGTGSGYQSAILAEIAGEVFSVERDPELSRRAAGVLGGLGYGNVRFLCGDGTLGWKENAPYDAMIVTAGSPDIPDPLKEQLAEGGRLVIPVGPFYGQTLIRVTRKGKTFRAQTVCGCVFVPLVGKFGWNE